VTVAVMMTVGDLRRRIARRIDDAFRRDGRDGTPALDARIIVAHVLGVAPNAIALIDERAVDEATEAAALALAERRIAGEPVARLTGRKEFWGHDFVLSPAALVPRPETETVVSAALDFIDETGGRERALSILDIGTGSGAILLALLSELRQATGVGTDRSRQAIATAAGNASRFGLAGRSRFITDDWASAVAGPFDLVVSNPPYIERGTIGGLAVEVRGHDPHLALDGGVDGLDAYRAIVSDLDRLVAKRGSAFLEAGAGQAQAVATIASEKGWNARFHRDLAGTERVVQLTRMKR
jgi:release factor glutamine methyltransferase